MGLTRGRVAHRLGVNPLSLAGACLELARLLLAPVGGLLTCCGAIDHSVRFGLLLQEAGDLLSPMALSELRLVRET